MGQLLQKGRDALWEVTNPKDKKIDPIVQKMMEKLPADATIFEYGTGRGRNLIPMLQAGFTVHAQDIWAEAIDDVVSNTREYVDKLILHKSNAVSHRITQTYDAFVCIRLLHFLKTHEAWGVINTMQERTLPGGFNAFSYFTDATEHKPEFFYPSTEELENSYLDRGWTTVIQSEICPSKPEETTNRKIMYQKSILFQKPA